MIIKSEKLERLPLKKYYIFSFLLSLTVIVSGGILQLLLPPEIPLFYGLPVGEEVLTKSIFIITPALVSMFITVLNAYFSIFAESTYLKKVLAASAISVSVLATITTIKIVFLVGAI